ncbi:MAG TPA: phage protease [Amycolatopsis sp.]|jgi:hypothetical protein|nr:phage protease [Amycolatopsis sp.]
MPERRTRTGVEIARTGTYNLSTGPHEFTRAQLQAALENAKFQAPVIGIGHTDPRFQIAAQDGDPAFGKVVNLRLADDGDLLVGDLTDIPAWLDDGMEIAYPRRSLEGRCDGDDLRLSSVKLLGTTLPGIKGLADLPAVLAASAAAGDSPVRQAQIATARFIAAATNVDDLRDAFYGSHPDNGEADWWSVQEVQINPNQLIVEHHVSGNETTFRVPWSVDADGNFTFGDMQQVAVQYVDIAAASGAHAVVYKAPGSRPAPTQREESIVDPKTLREQLGLAEDASDADVTAKLTELAARPDETAVKEQVAAAAEKAKTEAIAAAASTDDGETVKLDKATFAELKASAEKGAEAHKKIAETERDTFIAAAVGDGKFPPARVEHYTKRYDTDPDGTRAEIDALEKGVIPVKEIGASTNTDDTQLVTTGLFPQLQEA